jgi:ABC-type transporter Mla subunit MlaD
MNDSNNRNVPATTALHQGLQSTAVAVEQVAEFVRTHPTEIPEALEAAKAVSDNLDDLITAASTVTESVADLRQKMTATVQGADWVAEKFHGKSDPDDNEILRAQKYEKESPVFNGTTLPGWILPSGGCGCCYAGNDSFAELLQRQAGE